MKTYIVLLFLLPLSCLAQFKLNGTVNDNNNKPVPFADILLLTANDSVVYKSTFTDEAGQFAITGINKGEYLFKVTVLGYSNYYKAISINQDVQLNKISIEEKAKALNEVVINSKKPIVKRKIDRLEFNVENSILSTTNGWEIIKRTPGIIASATGTLSVRGSTSILVTINDKRIYMTGEQLKDFLEGTNGEAVKSVEVITNPPAKYDAQGSTVVNIKMKKNATDGYKAVFNAAYVQSMYPKGVVSTSQHYKNDGLSVSGGYTFGTGTYIRESTDVVNYLDDNGNIASSWVSQLNRKNTAPSQNTYNLTVQYEIDTLNVFTVNTNGYISTNRGGTYDVPTYIYDGSGNLDSLYTTLNKRSYPTRTGSYGAAYTHKFNSKSSIDFTTDYTMYDESETQDITSTFSLPDSNPYRQTRFVSDSEEMIHLFSSKLDYSYTGEKSGFETGVKFGKVKADNSLDYRDDIEGELVVNTDRTNQFLYDENIYAAYASYSYELGKWSFKGGLRGEYTNLEGNSVMTNEINTQDYFKLFPTAYVLYKPKDGHEMGVNYGKRISRPQYSWFNPFRSYYNSYSYFTGDPKLQPAVIHNVSLFYSLNNTYNFDVYYSHEVNPSMEISYQDYETSTVIYKFTNIDKRYMYGAGFNANKEFITGWEIGMYAGVYYMKDTYPGIDGTLYTNGRASFYGNIDNRIVISKEKGWNGEVGFSYSSAGVQGTFTNSATSNFSFGLRKKLLQGRAEAALLVNDLFKGEKQTVTTSYANQNNYFSDYRDTQSFRLAFKYNIGNQKVKENKNRHKTEEQERL